MKIKFSIVLLLFMSFSIQAEYKLIMQKGGESGLIKIPESNEEPVQNNETFSHLRIQVLDNNGSPSYVSLGDVNWVIEGGDFPSSPLSDYIDSPSPYKVVDNGFAGSNPSIYGGWHIYNDFTGQYDRWLGDIGETPYNIDLNLGQTFNYSQLEKIEILAGTHTTADYGSRSVSHFKVFISDDGVNWVEKMEKTGIDESQWSAGTKNIYSF